MICIHHSRDLDGWTSGAIVRLKYPQCKLIGYDYGQPFPWDEITRDEEIIMADVSLPMEDMVKLCSMAKSLIWIDHHISAINDFKKAIEINPITMRIAAVLDNTISACEGTWKLLFPDKQMPEAIKLLGEYDTWRNKDKHRWDNMILPFQFGMRLNCNSVESFPIHLFDDDSKDVVEVIKYGNVILKYQKGVNENQCKRAFEYTFRGYRAICANSGGFNSDLFKSVYDPTKHDIMMCFQYDGKNMVWIFSVYSDKPEVDCSVLCKEVGGGGHKGAAGFQVNGLDKVFVVNGPGKFVWTLGMMYSYKQLKNLGIFNKKNMENTTLKEEFDIFKQHVNSELERFKTKISEDDKKQVNRDFKNPMSWVTSFEDICMIAGVEPDNVGDKHRDTEDEIAYKQLKLIRKVITNDHKFNWDDENEKKWFPRFDMRSSGFGFSGTHYYFWGTNARVAARLCVRTENEAKFFGTVFVKIWEKYMKQ